MIFDEKDIELNSEYILITNGGALQVSKHLYSNLEHCIYIKRRCGMVANEKTLHRMPVFISFFPVNVKDERLHISNSLMNCRLMQLSNAKCQKKEQFWLIL